MTDTLSRLPLCDFIEMVCGNRKVLLEEGEEEGPELDRVAADLLYSYQCIVNPSGTEAALMDKEERVKLKCRMTVAKIMNALLSLNADDDVATLLSEMGYKERGHKEMQERVGRILAEVRYLQKRIDDSGAGTGTVRRSPDEVRNSFDREIAFLMTYFKMNIDPRTTTAGIYANMLHQADVEIKGRLRRR